MEPRLKIDDLPALPRACHEPCRGILTAPLLGWAALRQRTGEYLAAIETEAERGTFLDLPLARQIANALEQLLVAPAYPAGSPQHQALQLAVLYFDQEDDAEPDAASVLGFEDDAEVLNTVLRFVGREDLLIEIP